MTEPESSPTLAPTDGAGEPDPLLARVNIVLVCPSHPGNIGAAARAMKSMGLARLSLVDPARFPSAEATARAAGADDLLVGAGVYDDLESAIATAGLVVGTSARERHIAWPSLDPGGAARRAVDAAAGGTDVALVFGREASGLTNAELDRCHALVTIPTAAAFRSLNLAAAVQILAYELRRHAHDTERARTPEDPDPVVDAREVERFHRHLEEALVHVGYLDPSAPKLLMRRMRRLFGRVELRRSEVAILRGILAAMQRCTPASRG